jgi:hypothetical protein
VLKGFAVAVAFVLLPRPAAAQDSGDVAAARELGKRGAIAAQAGRCEEAIDLLSKAKALVSQPTILTPLGECQIKLGHLVDGTENLQASAHAELGASPKAALVQARDRAKDLLQTTLPRLAHLTIVVRVAAGITPKVTDNGIIVNLVLLGIDHPVDPGKHAIEVNAPGYFPATAVTSLAEGQSATATLELRVDPNARAVPVTPQLPIGTVPVQPIVVVRRDPTQLIAGIVTASVGVAALGVGGGLGGAALAKKSSLNTVCDATKHCPTASQGDIDSMKTLANTSTALFAVGGAAAGVGLIVILTSPSLRSSPQRTGITVTPVVGLASAGIDGTF